MRVFIALCWSIIRKTSLWHSNDLHHIISMSKFVFKFNNIETFPSLDSGVLNLSLKKFEVHTVCNESVTIIDLKSVSVITETCKSSDSTDLIVSVTNYVFVLFTYLNSFSSFDPCNIRCYI